MTDLEQMSKELELVKKREIDPFAKPMEQDYREIKDERVVNPSPQRMRFGSTTFLSDEMIAYANVPQMLFADTWIKLTRAISDEATKTNYLIDRSSVRIGRYRDDNQRGEKLTITCEGIKTKQPLGATNNVILNEVVVEVEKWDKK